MLVPCYEMLFLVGFFLVSSPFFINFAIILLRKCELVALLNLYSCCTMTDHVLTTVVLPIP